MNATESLQRAIDSAHNGDMHTARVILRRIVKADPQNEIAWDWLGEVAADINERVEALDNVVRINPLNSRAQSSLYYLRDNHADITLRQNEHRKRQVKRARQWLNQARDALRQGQHKTALDLMVRYVEVDDSNITAWLLLSELAPSLEDKIVALQNVLTLNPEHKEAQKRVKKLRAIPTEPLARGLVYENLKDWDNAINLYIEASIQAKTPAERMRARQRLELAQIRQKTPQYKALHPYLTVIRLSAGPLALYFCLVLLQSGFNLLAASPILCLANFSVLLGGLLMALVSATPVVNLWHSLWQWFSDESQELARASLWQLAGVLIVAPFIILIVDSFTR